MFDNFSIDLGLYLELFDLLGLSTCPVWSLLNGRAPNIIWILCSTVLSFGPQLLVLTKHLADIFVVFLVDAEFDGFRQEWMLAFPSVRLMIFSQMQVDSADIPNIDLTLSILRILKNYSE